MTETKPMTVGDLRESIKDVPDDMPLYMDDEHECMEILSIRYGPICLWKEDNDEERDDFVGALILGVA